MGDIVIKKCSYCGKEFPITPEWAYKRGNKKFCSYPCSNADFKETEQRERERKELNKKRAQERYERYKAGIIVNSGQKVQKRAVLGFKVSGEFIGRFETVRDAAIAAKVAPSSIVNVAKGKRKSVSGYIWRYADQEPAENSVAESNE